MTEGIRGSMEEMRVSGNDIGMEGDLQPKPSNAL